MPTTITFLHTGNPTGLKWSVEHGDARVLFDFGLEHSPGRAPFSLGLEPRPGRELGDLIAVGAAPSMAGVYAGDRWDGSTHVFLSHLHLDHTSLVRFLHPDVPLYFPFEMEDVRQAAMASGEVLWRVGPPGWRVPDGATVPVGPIKVTLVAVDHDVPGATGFLVETPDLAIAFTGDHRRHGLHPELMDAFATRVRGCDLLVEECVGLGALQPPPPGAPPAPAQVSEHQAAAEIWAALAGAKGLVIANVYGMNRDRVAAVVGAAQASGRRVLAPRQPGLLAGRPAGEMLDDERLRQATEAPAEHVLLLGFDQLPLLIDLAPPPGSVFIHSGGPPLGPYDPRWQVMLAWVARFGLEFRPVYCGGHAVAEDLERLVGQVSPHVVAPVHTRAPELLQARGTVRLLPEAGRAYTAEEILQHQPV